MKKFILFYVFFILISISATAQKHQKRVPRGEKIKALKIAFITEKLELSADEAQKFWPIYNKFEKILHDLERNEKEKLRNLVKDAGGITQLTELEAKELFEKFSKIEQQISTSKRLYNSELKKLISFKKILVLRTTERDFVRDLMRNYRKRGKSKN